MSAVIKFEPREPDNDDPHLAGKARCLSCKHEWQSVAPVGTTVMECPACGMARGEFWGSMHRDEDHFTCNCGCSIFRIVPRGIYCPNCASWHRPYD